MKRFSLFVDHRSCWGDCDSSCGTIDSEPDTGGDWCKWSEVEALLLQRAQESQELLQSVLDAIKGTLDPSTNIADHPNVLFAQMERLKLESALTARAQEIEQVKAERDRHIESASRLAKAFADRTREWEAADAALVSRAPQPEKHDGECVFWDDQSAGACDCRLSKAALQDLIAEAVDSLFVNGQGERADRLVLTRDGVPPRDLGGWCRAAIVVRLIAALSRADQP